MNCATMMESTHEMEIVGRVDEEMLSDGRAGYASGGSARVGVRGSQVVTWGT